MPFSNSEMRKSSASMCRFGLFWTSLEIGGIDIFCLCIFQDPESAKTREVLLARKRQLVEKFAKGNRAQAARALTEAEEDLLFDKGLFGNHKPKVLQGTVWWAIALHFGFRARDESPETEMGKR